MNSQMTMKPKEIDEENEGVLDEELDIMNVAANKEKSKTKVKKEKEEEDLHFELTSDNETKTRN